MNWLEHYRKAEHLLSAAAVLTEGTDGSCSISWDPSKVGLIAAASAHAELAKVALMATTPHATHDGFEAAADRDMEWSDEL